MAERAGGGAAQPLQGGGGHGEGPPPARGQHGGDPQESPQGEPAEEAPRRPLALHHHRRAVDGPLLRAPKEVGGFAGDGAVSALGRHRRAAGGHHAVLEAVIHRDKLVSAGKSKRKRLESTFEEQQEKLRILHDKFKEEVNQQLLGCRNSLEDFEAYHAELKGVADKQKASHKKLLLNAEKTVGSELNDAETKTADVQKSARNRMNGLKYVLKELIAETVD